MIRRIIASSLQRLAAVTRGGTGEASAAGAPPALDDAERTELAELRRFKAEMDAVERAPGHTIPIFLDYPVSPVPRYGHGKPPHPEIHAMVEAGRAGYRTILERVLEMKEWLTRIPVHQAARPGGPQWRNDWIPALDTAVLYTVLVNSGGRRYLEVGSGHSTRFARQAISDHGLATTITSIDPRPRAEIDAICDEVIRAPLEACDSGIFAQLGAGDILFVDNSHRTFMNSDATICFLDLLPRLKPGVLVHFHDIFLPEDYAPEWATRYYSEQYLLAAYLLGGAKKIEITCANRFITLDPELSAVLQPLWEALPGVERHGSSFWLTTT